jgi:CheY-like chemotaxis protein
VVERCWAHIERVRATEALHDADRRKSEFLATLAHELRNPLAPIRNGLEIMRMGADKPGSALRLGGVRAMMERQVGHMVHLINDLLDIARVSSGKLVLQMQPVDLRDVIATAIETSKPLIDAAGHGLSVDLPLLPVPVDVDPVRISQVVSNLLSNAAKYTPHGGRIVLTARIEGNEAVVTVRDNGVGIAADMLAAVFEMFTQVARSIERANGGLGIGLSLVRRLVELHGGAVSAQSAGVGLGSSFAVRLPLMTAALVASPKPAAADAQHGEQSVALQVLVADDNVDAAATLAALLEIAGHTVRVVHDGAAAVEEAARFQPDLVFLDIGMPLMDGYEAARRLRQLPALDGVMLVALTGWGTEEDRARSRAAGFDRHLLKPALPDDVEAVLAAATSATAAARAPA